MLNADWVVGFTEGEGTFTVHAHWNHTTRDGMTVQYRIDSPTFQVAQKGREVCDLLVEFFGFGFVNYRAQSDSWEYRVIGYEKCRRIALFFRGRLVLEKRRLQFDKWCTMGLLDDSKFDSNGRYKKGHSKVEDEDLVGGEDVPVDEVVLTPVQKWMKEHPEEVAKLKEKVGI